MVVFTSDHGFHLGERQWWNKNTLYEHSCRVPLMVAAPGVQPGVSDGIVELIDLFPTLNDLCQLPAPPTLPGTSFTPLLSSPGRSGKPFAHTMVMRGEHQRGDTIRTDRWRYTQWSDGSRELYDHHRDELEWFNVAGQRKHAGTIQRLQRQLDSVRRSTP